MSPARSVSGIAVQAFQHVAHIPGQAQPGGEAAAIARAGNLQAHATTLT